MVRSREGNIGLHQLDDYENEYLCHEDLNISGYNQRLRSFLVSEHIKAENDEWRVWSPIAIRSDLDTFIS